MVSETPRFTLVCVRISYVIRAYFLMSRRSMMQAHIALLLPSVTVPVLRRREWHECYVMSGSFKSMVNYSLTA